MALLVDTLLENIIDEMVNSGNGDVDACSDYGEMGYEKEHKDKPILFADWNPLYDKYPNVMEYIENNYNFEWIDEWVIDYNNDKCYRCVGDSYGWEQQFRVVDGELLTPDCDPEDWIDYTKIDQNNNYEMRVLPSFLDIELDDYGFELINDDLENGWYGRNDDPQTISDDLFEQGFKEVIFVLKSNSQFATYFEVWAKR